VENSTKNWWENLDFVKIRTYPDQPTVQVHAGFVAAWQSVKSQVMQAIMFSQQKCNCKDITFTGHSLGGAMAVLAAMDFYRSYNIVPNITTFGCPRIGNTAFSNYFNATIGSYSARIVNMNDIVPHVPLESQGFHHVKTEYWFKNGTLSYITCNGSGEDPNCADDNVFLWSITDHMTYQQIPISAGYPHNCGGPSTGSRQAYYLMHK